MSTKNRYSMVYCGDNKSINCKSRVGIVDVYGDLDLEMYLTNSDNILYEIIEGKIVTELINSGVIFTQIHQWHYEIRFRMNFDFDEFKTLLSDNSFDLVQNEKE